MATSKLQIEVGDLLDKTFPEFTIRENYRPDWLISSNYTLLELDFYIEELKIAFEVQGRQHYEFVPFFHVEQKSFDQQQRYDREKKDLCDGAGIELIELFSWMDAIIEIKSIREHTDKINSSDLYIVPDEQNLAKQKRLLSRQLTKSYTPITYDQFKTMEHELFLARSEVKELKAYIQKLQESIHTERMKSIVGTPEHLIFELHQWERKAIKRMKEQADLDFKPDAIPAELALEITALLSNCKTPKDIHDVFSKYR